MMETNAPKLKEKSVNDLVSRFEQLKPDDELKKHSELCRKLEEQYRTKHLLAAEKLAANDMLLASKLQKEEENEYKELMRQRSEDLLLQEAKVQEMIRQETESIKRLDTDIPAKIKVDPENSHESSSLVSVYAGKAGSKGFLDGVLLNEARFCNPTGLVLMDQAVIVADTGNNCLRKISDGIVAVICGSSGAGDIDGEPWTAKFNSPKGLAVNNAKNIFVADQDNNKIRIVFGTDWSVSTVAGAGKRGHRDGAADQALFNRPEDVALGWDGDIYVADTMNHVIRRIDCNGMVTTVAGKAGMEGHVDGAASDARFCQPTSLAFNLTTGCLFVAERTGRPGACIRCLDVATSSVLTLPDSDDLGHCTLSIAADGDVLLSDDKCNQVLALADDGQIYVVIDGCDGTPEDDSLVTLPSARAISKAAQAADRTMYISDCGGHCIHVVRFRDLSAFGDQTEAIRGGSGMKVSVAAAQPLHQALPPRPSAPPPPHSKAGGWERFE